MSWYDLLRKEIELAIDQHNILHAHQVYGKLQIAFSTNIITQDEYIALINDLIKSKLLDLGYGDSSIIYESETVHITMCFDPSGYVYYKIVSIDYDFITTITVSDAFKVAKELEAKCSKEALS